MSPARHGHRAPNIAAKARTARVVAKAVDLAPIIAELRASGITSLNGIASALDARAVPTVSELQLLDRMPQGRLQSFTGCA
jgi:hypothetical protein